MAKNSNKNEQKKVSAAAQASNVATKGAAKLVKTETKAEAAKVVSRTWSRHAVALILCMRGLDGAMCWLGNQISDSLCNSLSEGAGKLSAAKLGAGKSVFLTVDARKVFGWQVTVSGDVYERLDGNVKVRGSIALLERIYGKANVATHANGKAAAKALASKKWDKDCAAAAAK